MYSLSQSKPAVLVAKNGLFFKGILETISKINQKNVFKSLASLNRPSEMGKKKSGDAGASTGNAWRDLKKRIHHALLKRWMYLKLILMIQKLKSF